ncbi:MAG: flagellar motor switch protein FliN [Flavobacteriaceae bacterium]
MSEPTESPFETLEAVSDDARDGGREDQATATRSAADLEALFDVPVRVSAVLGRAKLEVSDLLKLDHGSVVELDRKVGEAIEIFVNDRLIARGEVVLVDDKLGITMTEIIKQDRG